MTKIKIAIKNRFTGSIIFEYEKENATIKDAVLAAIETNADLRYADLSYADMPGTRVINGYMAKTNRGTQPNNYLTYLIQRYEPQRTNTFLQAG